MSVGSSELCVHSWSRRMASVPRPSPQGSNNPWPTSASVSGVYGGDHRFPCALLPAVDPFLHGSVPEALEFGEFAAPEGAHIGFGRGFSAGGDLAEDDHDVIVVGGEETGGRRCEGLLC